MRQVSLSLGFVLGRGREKRACACGVEDRIRGVASVDGDSLGYVLEAIYRTIRSDSSCALKWQGRSGQQTSECLADVSPMGINRGVGTLGSEGARGHVRR